MILELIYDFYYGGGLFNFCRGFYVGYIDRSRFGVKGCLAGYL